MTPASEGGSHRLEGLVALVTGASSGIGEATAYALAREGADIALIARRGNRLEELAAHIRTLGREALALETDVTDEAAVRSSVGQLTERFGRLDVAVVNAGLMLVGPAEHASSADWHRMVDVNVLGVLHTARAVLPHLLSAAEGPPREVADLVLISSTAGRVVRPTSNVYALTKHGINAFGEALRQEFTARHVRVSLVEPGSTETELLSHNRQEVQERSRARLAKMERLQPGDIADAVVYVATRPRHVAINEVLVRPTEQSD